MTIYCNNCKYYQEDINCCNDLTIGILDIPLKECDGYKEKSEGQKFIHKEKHNE